MYISYITFMVIGIECGHWGWPNKK